MFPLILTITSLLLIAALAKMTSNMISYMEKNRLLDVEY